MIFVDDEFNSAQTRLKFPFGVTPNDTLLIVIGLVLIKIHNMFKISKFVTQVRH